jgi:hypothetical protein
MSAHHLRNPGRRSRLSRRVRQAVDTGQTALVLVVALSLVLLGIAGVLINTISASDTLQQSRSSDVYSYRALEAGVNAFLVSLNTNTAFSSCNSSTNNAGTCNGIEFNAWNKVVGSDQGGDTEYYAFGNPQPTFYPSTSSLYGSLDYLTVEIAGAAATDNSGTGYKFQTESIQVTPANGYLNHVWWTYFEQYNPAGTYNKCQLNWNSPPTPTYNVGNTQSTTANPCYAVYFGAGDYLNGPVFSDDSIFVDTTGSGASLTGPAFGNGTEATPVQTVDPNCLFVDANNGMDGSDAGCTTVGANDKVTYDTTQSSYGNTLQDITTNQTATPSQLTSIAKNDGCLYQGPTTITLSTVTSGANAGMGQMVVDSPDTAVTSQTAAGNDPLNNSASNQNTCPNDGSTPAPLPANGVVYVQTAPSASSVQNANPFDDGVYNTATNLTTASTPAAGSPTGTITATVKSGTNGTGDPTANVGTVSGTATPGAITFALNTATSTVTCTDPTQGTSSTPPTGNVYTNCAAPVISAQTTSNITGCTSLSAATAGGSSTSTSTATCPSVNIPAGSVGSPTRTANRSGTKYTYTQSTPTTGVGISPWVTATYAGNGYYTGSNGSYGTTNAYTPTYSFGPDAQINSGSTDCTITYNSTTSQCYYGAGTSPDTEADVFVNGSLSGQLTIGAGNDIVVDGNTTYKDCTWSPTPAGGSINNTKYQSYGYCNYNPSASNDALGLIASAYVEVNRPVQTSSGNVLPQCGATGALLAPLCDPAGALINGTYPPGESASAVPNGLTNSLTIDAAMLALYESFVVNNYTQSAPSGQNNTLEGLLMIYGSIEQYARGPVALQGSTGYTKYYTWDPLLNFVSPPSYANPAKDSWVLATSAGNLNVANSDAASCPSLPAPYGSTSQPSTSYCATGAGQGGDGALPNYG